LVRPRSAGICFTVIIGKIQIHIQLQAASADLHGPLNDRTLIADVIHRLRLDLRLSFFRHLEVNRCTVKWMVLPLPVADFYANRVNICLPWVSGAVVDRRFHFGSIGPAVGMKGDRRRFRISAVHDDGESLGLVE